MDDTVIDLSYLDQEAVEPDLNNDGLEDVNDPISISKNERVTNPLFYDNSSSLSTDNDQSLIDCIYLTSTAKEGNDLSSTFQNGESDISVSLIIERSLNMSELLNASQLSMTEESSFYSTPLPVSPTFANENQIYGGQVIDDPNDTKIMLTNTIYTNDNQLIPTNEKDKKLSKEEKKHKKLNILAEMEQTIFIVEDDHDQTIVAFDDTILTNEEQKPSSLETEDRESATFDCKTLTNDTGSTSIQTRKPSEQMSIDTPDQSLGDWFDSSVSLLLQAPKPLSNSKLSPIVEEDDQTSSFPTLNDTDQIVQTALKRQSSTASSITRKLPVLPTKSRLAGSLSKQRSVHFDEDTCLDEKDGSGQISDDEKSDGADKPVTLLDAVKLGDFEAVKNFASRRSDMTLIDKHGRSISHVAAMHGFHQILEYSLNLDDKCLNIPDKTGKTLLHYAVSSRSIESVQLLFNRKANLYKEDPTGKTPLHIAAAENLPDILKLLIKEGKIISPRKRKSNKSLQLSAFEVAILNGNLEATKVFVENGLSETPFVKSKKGVSIKSSLLFPLHRACVEGDLDILKYYIDRNASLDIKNIVGFTPLMAAVRYGKFDVVHFLIKKGASLILKDWSLRTCLHIAVKYNRASILELLVLYTPRYLINSGDKIGNTPIHQAAKLGRSEELKILLNVTSYIEVDHKGVSPLHLSAQNGHLECVKLLLREDWYQKTIHDVINTIASDEERSTPIGMAAKGKHNDICKLLIIQGGKVEHLHHFATTEDFALVIEGLIDYSMTIAENDEENKPHNKIDFSLVIPEVKCLNHLLDCLKSLDERNAMRKEEKLPAIEKKWAGKLIDAFRLEVCEILDGVKSISLGDNRVLQFLKDDMAKLKGEREQVVMTQLITYSPDVTEYVLDRLIESNSDDELRFHYDLLDSPHTHRKTKNAFFAPAVMIETDSTLLHHPIIVKLLESNWIHVHIIMYMTSFVLYAFFLCLITSLVIVDKRQ